MDAVSIAQSFLPYGELVAENEGLVSENNRLIEENAKLAVEKSEVVQEKHRLYTESLSLFSILICVLQGGRSGSPVL